MNVEPFELGGWLESFPEPLIYVSLDLQGLKVSKAGLEFFGTNETVAQPFSFEHTIWQAPLEQARQTHRVVHDVCALPAADGEATPLRLHLACAFPVFNAAGELTHLGLHIRDLAESTETDLAAAQREQRLQDRLEHRDQQLAELNEELDAYVTSLAQELQGPLRRVQGFLKLLNHSHKAFDEKSQHFVTVARNENDRLVALAADLAQLQRFSRSDLQRRTVSLSHLVAQVQSDLAPAYPDRQVQWHIGALPSVHGDPLFLRQVFKELLHNALKFTAMRSPAVISIWAQEDEHEVLIGVRDNGVGFPAEQSGRLFHVFTRLHADRFEGAGVGLAAVRRIVARHGGRVWAEGDEGTATFRVSLPRTEAGLVRSAAVKRRVGHPRGPDTFPPAPTDSGLILEVFAAALHEAHLGVVITDRHHRMLYINEAFSRISGYTLSEVMGRSPRILRSPATPVTEYQALLSRVDSGKHVHQLIQVRGKGGQALWFNANISPLYEAGEVKYVMAMLEHANARVEAQQRLHWKANHDALTGLQNRQSLDQILSDHAQHPDPFALVLIDLDEFKSVNDQHGHLEGDRILREVAQALQGQTRANDQIFRLGGDEFLVILPGMGSDEVRAFGQRLRGALASVRKDGEAQEFSLGFALYPEDEHDMWHLMHRADQRMYAEKDRVTSGTP